jgi:DNA-binding transcriptional regulator YiaG
MTPAQIREFRKSLGLSAGAFARAIGVSDGSRIREWESGRREPHAAVATVILMAKGLPGGKEWLKARAKAV